MHKMAIFKATYTNQASAAKANIRYIQNRAGRDGAKITRTLWGSDGKMERKDAYQMIDEAEKGSLFFRFVISPDPVKEDTYKDIYMRDLTEQTMLALEDRLGQSLQWVAATHDDHTQHRHVHMLAILPKKLQVHDLKAMRQISTDIALDQRQERDRQRELKHQQERGKSVQWEHGQSF